MAAEFVGLTVLVTLQSPPNAQIQGLVANVTGRQLYLRDGNSILSLYRPSSLLICI